MSIALSAGALDYVRRRGGDVMQSEGSTEIASQVLVVGFWVIFVGSVLGKLDGWNRWSSLASALPLPRRVSAAVRVLLPLVEAAVAGLLVVAPVAGLLG